MHWLSWEPLCEPNFMYFCIKSSIGTQEKLASCKSALNPTVACSTDRSIAITSLGEERANLCAFRTFVRFVLV